MNLHDFHGVILLHAGEEFVPVLPFVLLVAAWLLISWAGKNDTRDAPEE